MSIPQRLRLVLALALSGSLLAASRANAWGFYFDWGDCADSSAIRNANFTAPAVYRLVLSIKGHQPALIGWDFVLKLDTGSAFGPSCSGPNSRPVPPAWQFEPGGCEPAGAFRESHTPPPGSACVPLPLVPTQSFATYEAMPGYPSLRLVHVFVLAATPVVPDPATGYVLENFEFDMSNAVAGAGSTPGSCGGAALPACWTVISAEYIDTAGSFRDMGPMFNGATWNDPANLQFCGFYHTCTDAHPATWGQLKARYR